MADLQQLRAAVNLLADECYESGLEIGELIEERRSRTAASTQAAPLPPSPESFRPSGGGEGQHKQDLGTDQRSVVVDQLRSAVADADLDRGYTPPGITGAMLRAADLLDAEMEQESDSYLGVYDGLLVSAEVVEGVVSARSRTVVEAIEFTGTGENCSAVTEFLGGVHDGRHGWNKATNTGGMVNTLRGVEEFTLGDWIVRETNTFAVYAPRIFDELFEVTSARARMRSPESFPSLASATTKAGREESDLGGDQRSPSAEVDGLCLGWMSSGKHSWRFDGDDPYVVCVYCGWRRDALTGKVITSTPRPEAASKSSSPSDHCS